MLITSNEPLAQLSYLIATVNEGASKTDIDLTEIYQTNIDANLCFYGIDLTEPARMPMNMHCAVNFKYEVKVAAR